jgi:hypothetical protein
VIVRGYQNQLLLITQPDHAALSAQVMARWTADGLPEHPRRTAILLATREHDAGWADVDDTPIVDDRTGRILDFVQAPDEIRQGVWPRSVDRLSDEPYAAALVAQHALHVYRDNRAQPAWADFFARIEHLRARHLDAAAPLTLDDLARDYFFVRMGDLVSLFFANHWPGPRAEGDYVVRASEAAVTVSPDPFSGVSIPFTLRGRLLSAGPFSSAVEAGAAFGAAPLVTLDAVALGS